MCPTYLLLCFFLLLLLLCLRSLTQPRDQLRLETFGAETATLELMTKVSHLVTVTHNTYNLLSTQAARRVTAPLSRDLHILECITSGHIPGYS